MSQYSYPIPPIFPAWMCTIGYAVGIDYYGNPVSPGRLNVRFNRTVNPPLTVLAVWDVPVAAGYFYGRHELGYYTDPIIIVPDYPVYGIGFNVRVVSGSA
ncbi:MAG: hypothetical protein LM577_07045 [Thermoproteaceae archaeon]|nr:hypothetical protein [Thermoproteaceae archaeon]